MRQRRRPRRRGTACRTRSRRGSGTRPGWDRRGVYAWAFRGTEMGERRRALCSDSGTRRREIERSTANRSGRGRPMNPRWELAWRSRPAAGAARPRRPTARAPRSCCRAAGTRASARSACCARCSSASIVPDVVIGTSAGALNGAGDLLRAEPHRRRAARRGVGAAPQRPRVPRRQDPPGLERRAPRHAPLRERRASKRSSTTARPPARSPISRSRCA